MRKLWSACLFLSLFLTTHAVLSDDMNDKRSTGKALASFDPKLLEQSAKDVCDYVTKAYNLGKEKEISSHDGKLVTADGKTIDIVVGGDGGSCASDEIKIKGHENDFYSSENLLKSFIFENEQAECGWDITLIPFHGKYYTVSGMNGIPHSVIDPNKGPVCKLSPGFERNLVENKSPELCLKFSREQIKPNVKWTSLKDDEIEKAAAGPVPGEAHFDRVTEASFDGEQPIRIGHFNIEWDGGSGCEQGGIAILDGNEMRSKKLEPNKSLLKYQYEWWECHQADADLTKIGMETYVTAWGGLEFGSPSVLLKLEKGTFQPICRVEQKMIFGAPIGVTP